MKTISILISLLFISLPILANPDNSPYNSPPTQANLITIGGLNIGMTTKAVLETVTDSGYTCNKMAELEDLEIQECIFQSDSKSKIIRVFYEIGSDQIESIEFNCIIFNACQHSRDQIQEAILGKNIVDTFNNLNAGIRESESAGDYLIVNARNDLNGDKKEITIVIHRGLYVGHEPTFDKL